MNPQPTKRWRILRRCLIGLAGCVTLIGLFYTEELWRGKRAWDECKRTLQAQGVNLDWTNYVPAPVPTDQNVFGVPEMQKWFTGRGATELSKKMSYPRYPAGRDPGDHQYPNGERTARLVVAELMIVLPGADAPSASNASFFQWGDPHARADAVRLIKDALGPLVLNPIGFIFMLRGPEEIRPAQIRLRCQTAPNKQELLEFLPHPIANTDFPDSEKIQLEPVGDNSYKVTISAPDTVAEYLKWSAQLEPEFTLIRQALQRPSIRMNGDYSVPYEIPIPNFVTVRATVQTLATMAQCHLLQARPEEALRDLTFMHDLCGINTNQPITLVGAMINAAVRGLFATTIGDGLRWRAWREPDLAALQAQLKLINVLLPLKQAFEKERVGTTYTMENTPSVKLLELFMGSPSDGKKASWTVSKCSILGGFLPRGWLYQNMVSEVNLDADLRTLVYSSREGEIIFSDKVEAFNEKAHAFSPWSPYAFMLALAIPNFTKAYQSTANNQTLVNQALIACGLERYRLAHGQYPETLDALVPRFVDKIPYDVIGGQPPHYRSAMDGTFLLYSVGWSGRDGGGMRSKTTAEGDWVWPD
jgi:hypothetical protein